MNENENNIPTNEEQNNNIQNNLGEMPINNTEVNSEPEVISTSIPTEPVVTEAPVESQIEEPTVNLQPKAPVITETPVAPASPVVNEPAAPTKKKNVAGIVIGIIAGSLVLLIIVIVAIVLSLRGAFNKAVNTAITKPSTNTSTTTENKNTVSNDTKSPYKTRKSKTNPSVKINLTGMTGKEIVDNVLDCTEISNGDKAYYYTDRFVYESPNYILVNREHKFGKGPSWSWKDTSKDAYITHVSLYSIKEKDDGTIVILDNPQVQVSLQFKTYETGKETYDAFCDLFDTIGETYAKETERGVSYHLEYNDHEYFVSFNNPSKEGRPYEMFVWIPVMYFMAEK